MTHDIEDHHFLELHVFGAGTSGALALNVVFLLGDGGRHGEVARMTPGESASVSVVACGLKFWYTLSVSKALLIETEEE